MPIILLLSMLDKIIILDFEDSFTYNIASVLFPHEKSIKVVSYLEFFKCDFKNYLNTNNKHALILGPGPGHPNEYKKYFLEILKFREHEKFYIMGICLGHQILGVLDEKSVSKASEQVHGQSVLIEFEGEERIVQRYNSLSVYEDNKEVNIRRFERGISYQFHPESIGTEDSLLYFQELLNFIKI